MGDERMPIIHRDIAARRIASGDKRIAIVGSTGSGKTTLAKHLARQLGSTHVELDALHWDPNWTPAPTAIFRDRAAAALDGAAWIVDGNYSKVRDVVWSGANMIIWLDYPLPIILFRLTRRTLWRLISRVELWNGNRERFHEQFFSRDSIFLWALSTYRRRRREYPALFAQPEHAHLTVIHLRSPAHTRRLLAALAGGARSVAQ
jgi:adenylate kinase family enzyme